MRKPVLIVILIFCHGIMISQELVDSLLNLSMEDLLQVKVEVGTRGVARLPFESPVPIDVITSEEIALSGLTDLVDVIQRFIPSVYSPRTSITDGSDHIRAFSLRGLGADQMLVLVNGVRKSNTAMLHVNTTILRGTTSNDLNVIPVNAIERIEILRDGAAAQYGSDAISGIINIILKEKPDQNVSAFYRQTTKDDGVTINASANFGFSISETDYLSVSVDSKHHGATNRSIPRTDLTGRDSIPALLNHQIYRLGDAETNDISINFNYSHQFVQSPSSVFYAFGNLNYRQGESAGYYRLPSQERVPLYGFPEGFLPLLTPVMEDKEITLGYKTIFNGWNLNSGYSFNYNSIQYNLKNSLNSSLGPESPRDFYCGTLFFSQNLFFINMLKAVNLGLTDNLQIAFGAELRYEKFIQEKGEEKSFMAGNYSDSLFYENEWIVRKQYPAGAQMVPGYMPENEVSKSRNNVSSYIDLEQVLFSKLLVNIAGRYENYSDFGNSLNGKLALRFAPIEKLALRTSMSTGFRAPSINQSYYSAISTNLVDGQLIQSGTYSVDESIARELGATDLKPELSKHYSAGLALKLINNLDISFDYFYVRIDNRIALTGTFALSSTSQYVRDVLTKYNVEGVKYFTNGFNTISQGFDIVARYNVTTGTNSGLMFTWASHFNQSVVSGDIQVPEILPDGEDVFFDRKQISRIEDGQPKQNHILSATWSNDKYSGQVKFIKYGDVTYVENATDPSLDQVFKGKTIIDLSLKYQLGKKIVLQAGVNNLFNSYPDTYLPGRGDYYLVYYTEGSPFGVNGTEVYGKFVLNF
ncbi:MAG: TonB-dependent receptor [Bacteroidales bacterium]